MRIVASQRRGVVCSPIPVVNETPCDSKAPDATSATQTNDSSMLKCADGGNAGKTLTRVRSSSRLLKQSEVQAKSDNRGKRQSDRHKPKTEDQCPVCSRNIKSKAAHCEMGKHWVHYKCDKLTETEINRPETDTDMIYNCKNCLSQNTCPKTVINEPKGKYCVSPQNKLTLQIPNISKSPNPQSPASAILKEETMQICCVCDDIIESDEAICDTCKSSCHVTCMVASDPGKCIPCGANDMQVQSNNITVQQIRDTITNQSDLHHSRSNTSGLLPVQPTPVLDSSDGVLVNQVNSELDSSDGVLVNQVNSAPKQIQAKQNKKEVDTNSNKQRELRQWDSKLCKWEEELKLREAKSNDVSKEFTRLEEYIRKTEARNIELEKTVLTMQRKINLLEYENSHGESVVREPTEVNPTGTPSDSHTYTNHQSYARTLPPNNQTSPNSLSSDQLIIGVREQVTQFIMTRVKNELAMLERTVQQ